MQGHAQSHPRPLRVHLAPLAVGTDAVMTLVLTCDGLAESDRAVLVVVGEANPITGAGQTGEDGAFTFTYRGSRSGQDSVRFLYPESGDVEAQTVSDLTEVTSSVVWVGRCRTFRPLAILVKHRFH